MITIKSNMVDIMTSCSRVNTQSMYQFVQNVNNRLNYEPLGDIG